MKKEIKNYLLNNEEDLIQVLIELAKYDELSHLQFYVNDREFFEYFYNSDPYMLVCDIEYGDFRIDDEFVKFEDYDEITCLVSFNHDDLVKDARDNIDLITKVLLEHPDDFWEDKYVSEEFKIMLRKAIK